jgi:hypothetical protein
MYRSQVTYQKALKLHAFLWFAYTSLCAAGLKVQRGYEKSSKGHQDKSTKPGAPKKVPELKLTDLCSRMEEEPKPWSVSMEDSLQSNPGLGELYDMVAKEKNEPSSATLKQFPPVYLKGFKAFDENTKKFYKNNMEGKSQMKCNNLMDIKKKAVGALLVPKIRVHGQLKVAHPNRRGKQGERGVVFQGLPKLAELEWDSEALSTSADGDLFEGGPYAGVEQLKSLRNQLRERQEEAREGGRMDRVEELAAEIQAVTELMEEKERANAKLVELTEKNREAKILPEDDAIVGKDLYGEESEDLYNEENDEEDMYYDEEEGEEDQILEFNMDLQQIGQTTQSNQKSMMLRQQNMNNFNQPQVDMQKQEEE